ncbi:OsmC family protein [Sphingosinicella sp. LHD-64]|uniref:OsmC family protein n=1 Tax=Sphingosinicella sp. LHD-64 TaxID=3072139 RepID=UPI00280F0DDD|nr:OsmC family protein [Sphingosinicella sp. LHD-64]MDQ8758343.1 OsmC family protein [Sphingosinicella sp. LHD-64]
MAKHVATIEWRSDGQFASGRYSRRHEWRFDGGAVVPGSSSPDVVRIPMSDRAAVDPEEALVASASSCHMLSFLWVAQQAGFEVESYSDTAEGTMSRVAPGRMGITRIALRPRIAFVGRAPTAEELAHLHHEAHVQCFIANSLKTEIVIEPAD